MHNIRRRHYRRCRLLCIHHINDVKTVAPNSTLSHRVVQVVAMAGLPAGCCRLCVLIWPPPLSFVVSLITPCEVRTRPGTHCHQSPTPPHNVGSVEHSCLVRVRAAVRKGQVRQDGEWAVSDRGHFMVCVLRCVVTPCVFKCVVFCI